MRDALREKFVKMRVKEDEALERARKRVVKVKKNLPAKGARWTKPVGEYDEISLVKNRKTLGTLFRHKGGWAYEMPGENKPRDETLPSSGAWIYDLDEAKAIFRKMIDGWAIEAASVPHVVYDDDKT
ncbi:hypothetical protein A2839_02805 [Candidatus Uhrbacteria bacterium RIFCSPHIGHO2_01_FULL_47_10]|nr:MAG: hypothetical protein A2839_02805 [Candidatus Uhrbacteria bacterium RIFCSPHIGHO2_01_FULL_47_10]